MKASHWLNVDLHIHSFKSNLIKKNDYKGNEYTATDLLNKLLSQEKEINLFSVTDHNIVNVDLYDNLQTLVNSNQYKGKINYVIGVEIDIFDSKIYDKKIHALCLFKSRNHQAVSDVIDSLDLKNKKYIDNLQLLFNSINDKLDEKKFILIPHFNNKHKGVPSNLDNIIELTRLMFDAYEDSNNVRNIQRSLSKYLEKGFVDFPFVAFSDCHNIDFYPYSGKSERKIQTCSFLGNITYPFETIKTAFEEPRLRISIHNVENMRKHSYCNQLLSKVYYENEILEFSPSLNSIIGPFGSGKSFLINKIVNGIKNIDEKYSKLVDKNKERFLLEVNGTKYNSLKEVKEQSIIDDIIHIEQDEDLFYKNTVEAKYIQKLSGRLGFKVPILENKVFDFKIDELINSLDKFIESFNKSTNAYSINYLKAFEENKGYLINSEQYTLDYESAKRQIQNNKIDLDQLIELTVSGTDVFSSKELEVLKNTNFLLDRKIYLLTSLGEFTKEFYDCLEQNLNKFNLENDNKNDKTQRANISDTIIEFSKLLKDLINHLIYTENVLTESIFNNLKKVKETETIGEYEIVCHYDLIENEYKSLTKHLYSNITNETLVHKIFDSIYKNSSLRQNKSFNSSNLKDSLENYQMSSNKVFNENNLKYDILFDKAKSKSITNLSAGGRARELLKIAFAKILVNMQTGRKSVVVIDQPENNMDNENINTLIVEKIKEIKVMDKQFLIQFIIVTHNANVCITSDSENIIIASNPEKHSFNYASGCIENTEFIKCVCDILEGGEQALKTRAVKYNINILKGMEINEAN